MKNHRKTALLFYDKRFGRKEKFRSKWVVNKKAGHQESRLQFRPLIDDLHVQRHKGLITRKGTNTTRPKKSSPIYIFVENVSVTDKPIDGCFYILCFFTLNPLMLPFLLYYLPLDSIKWTITKVKSSTMETFKVIECSF